jgi:hypothetical protein
MWVWLALAAVAILLYVLISGKSKKQTATSSGQQQHGGFGRALLPEIILERLPGPPHTHHRHHRGGHHHHDHHHHHRGGGGVDPGGPMDPADAHEAVALDADRQKAARDPGPGTHHIPGHNRRHMRGEPIPGELVSFKTAEQGQTPSLADVANQYDTNPEAIVMEAEGRGYPNSTAWKRYVTQHNWGDPLPPATQLSILAHPQ